MWLASNTKRRKLNCKYTNRESIQTSIIENSEHLLEIIAPKICRYLSYKDLTIRLCHVSKAINKAVNTAPIVTDISVFFAQGIAIFKTNIGLLSENDSIIAFLEKFHLRNVTQLDIETSIQQIDSQWVDSVMFKHFIHSLKQIKRLQKLTIDVYSTNNKFVKGICNLIRNNLDTIHTIKLLSTTLDIIIDNNDDNRNITFGEILKNQQIIDNWCSKIIFAFTNRRNMENNNVLKNVHFSFIGYKTCLRLCELCKYCNYNSVSIDVIECELLCDIAGNNNHNMKELQIKKYISNWNGFNLLGLFKNIEILGIPCGGMFPFTIVPLKTKVIRLYITKYYLLDVRYKLFEMIESVPGNVKRFEIWNTCYNLYDSEQFYKWWKWISYPLNKNCKQLLIRNMDINDIIDMFKHKLFANITLLIVKSANNDNNTYKRIKEALPEEVELQLQSLS